MPKRIKLHQVTHNKIERLAKQIHNKYVNVWGGNWAKESDLHYHTIGKRGEAAYSKYTKQTLDLNYYPYSGDGGVDFEDGAQVKTRDGYYGDETFLIINPRATYKDNPEVKKFVLACAVENKEIILVGEISKENFYNNYTKHKWGYVVKAKDLDILY
jgi:hypothetical protein